MSATRRTSSPPLTPTDDSASVSTRSAPASSKAVKRDVVMTGQFKKDMKREQKGRYRMTVQTELLQAVHLLADDRPLPAHMVDHSLGGDWKGHRDCHIKPDLILIYRKSNEPPAKSILSLEGPKLHLVRIGSHSELGL